VTQGHLAKEILRDIALQVQEVHSPKTRISLAELMTSCENAIRLSRDRHLPYRIGASIHISTYGMYGFAILCCPDFRDAMAFAWRYHSLAAPLATIEFSSDRITAALGPAMKLAKSTTFSPEKILSLGMAIPSQSSCATRLRHRP